LQGNPSPGIEMPVLHTIAFCLAAILAMTKTARGRIGYANYSRVSAYFDGNSLIKNTTKDAR
jgi:hypothetical protein